MTIVDNNDIIPAPMDKRLNCANLTAAMDQAGLNSAALARELSVSRESVRKWLSGESFPRPDKLLRLGKTVGLSFGDLIIKEEPHAPVVAFRKMRGTKTKDHHIENAQTMGRMLRHLVSFLPFDVLAMPPVLKDPSTNYDYLKKVGQLIRHEIHVGALEPIDFSHLIRHFGKLQATIVPVMWGSKKVHENATHIYLPDSQTTWVYLNLDVNIHDFKFWMAHELGHCLAPQLRGDEAEDFADAFASALLCPHETASTVYTTISKYKSTKKKLNSIVQLAEEHTISPITLYKQMNAFAASENLTPLTLEPDIHKWTTQFNKQYLNVSETLFDGEMPPEAKAFIEITSDAFETPFFDILERYLKETHKGPGYVQTVMDVPLLDARSFHDALI